MEFDDEIREFLIESNENLANLDREIIELEQNPADMQLISSAFRTIHTIKGTCGFFGFDILGSVTHITENILSQVREGQRSLTPPLISLVLESVDAVKALLTSIEATGSEGPDTTGPLRARLEQAHESIERTPNDSSLIEQTPLAKPSFPGPTPVASHSALAPPLTSPATSSGRVSDQAFLQNHLPVSAQPVPDGVADKVRPTAGISPSTHVANAQALSPATDADSRPLADSAREAQLADSTIRVDVALLNRLMDLVGELVLARNQLLQDASTYNQSLQRTSQRLNLITSELQEGVMKTRMQPIGVVWNKLPRVVRDLAAQCGKQIQIEMDGVDTELDKTIIEAIKDPLTHIVRNACDHGIELPEVRMSRGKRPGGQLLLRAYHEGGVVNLEISDDGAGIDSERVKAKAIEKGLMRAEQAAQLSDSEALHLIFLPGFSTAAAITSISGRGVGMDVVKTNIEKIGGSVEVHNRPGLGSGTTIRIKIPLTLAIIPGLVVTLEHAAAPAPARTSEEKPSLRRRASDAPRAPKREEERFIIPQANLLELVRLESPDQLKRIENVHGTHVFHHRGSLLPLVYLSRVLGWGKPLPRGEAAPAREAVNIVVVQAENRKMGLVVDHICDTQEIVVKPLGRQLKGLAAYVGATIMGDGCPALILDIAGLARLASLGAVPRSAAGPEDTVASNPQAQAQMLLLFRSGGYQRLAAPLACIDRLEEVDSSRIERAAGRPALHYRGEILPLLTLGAGPAHGADLPLESSACRQVIVFATEEQRFGLVVDQILDIVTEPVLAQRTSSPVAGLLGSALVGGRITDLLDLDFLAESARAASPEPGGSSKVSFSPPPSPALLGASSHTAVMQ